MAVPTFALVTPATGPAGGRNLVYITGTNFRLPDPVPPVGVVPMAAPQTVRVRVGGEDALRVDVTLTSELRVLMPAYRGDPNANPIAPVTIQITNLDNAGTPIPGETVTSAAVYTYARAALLAPRATGAIQHYKRASDQVLDVFRRQVHPSTFLANVSVDFGDTGVPTIKLASLPSVVLEGPNLMADPWRLTNHPTDTFNSLTGRWETRRAPMTRTLGYRMILLSDKKQELHALMQSVEELFMRNGFLFIDYDPTAPGTGKTTRDQCDFHMTELTEMSPGVSGSDLHLASGAFEVRGVEFELPETIEENEGVDVVGLQVQHLVLTVGVETISF